MKKAILTIGLFSLVMILTSFTTPETKNIVKSETNVNIIGQGAAGGNVKVDIIGQGAAGGNVKVDIIGQGAAGGNVKVD
ncbi:3-oxoacyl-ACP reductase [Flavobacterium gawalongense]|uniref:3-oxoacyl-ACP reductase n=1 Tax=Flavobacterium gawalongense TaxID=2594432 RepID=A0ABY3CMF8_9FLAO|nr:3-oxoacyl-ACP reductase [Flavobacterium gawalongense]TRX02244.1 3-oxoacyl-ACP reductase [Flavobacterium gawalongense]TRX07473.1 3-oxoacyl-ACP reductase [Flavobacterium gawalongense]